MAVCLARPQNAYREARTAPDSPPELVKALIYRVTVKRILARQLEMVEAAISFVQDIAAVRDQFQSSDENDKDVGHENGPSMVSAPVSSSRLDHLVASPPLPPSRPSQPPLSTGASSTTGGGIEYNCHQHHSQSHRFSLATAIDSPSFLSYLSDVESVVVYQ
ncbi:unnamed protein product, partial [Ectocarpus fasciculatus]